MSGRTLTWSILESAAILSLGFSSAAHAQSEADFFKGKTVNYIVATAPGGGYDYYGRLVSEYMQKHIPGSTFVVRNMPGAGHIIGANSIYASKPDGLTIGTFNTGLVYNQLVGVDSLKADLTKMSWIGKASTDPRAIVISTTSPIKTFDELQASKQVIFSTSGLGSAGYAETKVLSDMLNLPIKLVTGYNGNDDQLAMRRGEVTGTINTRSSWDTFVKNGYARYLVQIGGREKEIPQLSAFAKDADAKAVVALIESQGEIGRLTAGPPGIPPARLEVLRKAYKAAMEDKELQEKAAKGGRPVEPLYGDDVLKMVKAALVQSPKTVETLKKALTEAETPVGLKAVGPLLKIEDGKRITFNGPDGKPVSMEVSGSRTKVTISGKEAQRNELKVGQNCEVSYVANAPEPTTVTCQ
jgi:tripartite-type tricarboxylate transporter receptor subunit TctC